MLWEKESHLGARQTGFKFQLYHLLIGHFSQVILPFSMSISLSVQWGSYLI